MLAGNSILENSLQFLLLPLHNFRAYPDTPFLLTITRNIVLVSDFNPYILAGLARMGEGKY